MDLLAMIYKAKTPAVIAGLLTALICLPAALADGQNDSLERLERHLFFTTYIKEDLPTRLARLENRVFGQALQGTVPERLERLRSIAPATATVEQPTTTGSHKILQEDECYLDRAKVAVMAAKEEEVTALLAQGVELWRSRQQQAALEKFQQVLRLDPSNAEAHFSLGIIKEKSGQMLEALASYRQAVDSRPDSLEYKNALQAARKKASARQSLDAPQVDVQQITQEATAAYKRGEYLSALELYKTLEKHSPSQALVKYNIATVYLILKQPEKALLYYQQAHKLAPQDERFAQALNKLQQVVKNNQAALVQMGAKSNQPATRLNSQVSQPSEQSVMASYGILGKAADDGVYITTIGIASRAMQVGLQRGDIIRAVDGTIVRNPSQLNQLLSQKKPAPVQLIVQRQNSLTPVTL